jgi:hypothetical protein
MGSSCRKRGISIGLCTLPIVVYILFHLSISPFPLPLHCASDRCTYRVNSIKLDKTYSANTWETSKKMNRNQIGRRELFELELSIWDLHKIESNCVK